MTQEEKSLLLKDLSARLPYGVKIELTWWVMDEGTCINTALEPDHIEQLLNDEYGETEIKPYLRPMSSMTEEELTELAYKVFQQPDIDIIRRWVFENKSYPSIDGNPAMVIDWLLAHHFDFRGLIEKGLALEAPEYMYNVNEK